MKNNVKNFIEDNIKLIDVENFMALFLKAYDEISADELLEVQFILEKAGFNISEERDLALHTILDEKVQQYAVPQGGVSQMPVNEFLWVFLNNHFGVGYIYIEEYMMKHKDDWSDLVDLFETDGKNVISRKSS